jgi:hypothetical protein
VKLILAAVLSLLATPAWSAEPVSAFKGTRSVVQTKHLVPAMAKGEGYGEKYTFNADLGDRGNLYFSMTISNLGFGDHKMEAKGRLTLDGKSYKWKKALDDDEWKHGKAPFFIKAGPAKISGTPKRLVFEVAQGEGSFEFVFTPIANAWRPRNGQIQFGSDRKASDYTVFPLMAVSGWAKVGGEQIALKGTGYGTHSWSELAIYNQARWTMSFRGISGDSTVYVRELGLTKDYGRKRIAYLLVTKGSNVEIESFDYQMTPTEVFTDTKHANKYKVPESFQLLGKDAEEPDQRMFRGKVTKKKLRKRKDMLGKMNAATRAVVSRFSKPVSYSYDATYLLEVRVAGAMQRLEGVGRYEFTHLNK